MGMGWLIPPRSEIVREIDFAGLPQNQFQEDMVRRVAQEVMKQMQGK